MDSICISVILPVFKVEDYIGRCIQALKEQSFRDLEFIFVDDCSPDGSAALIEAEAAADPRFRLIRQAENGGAGAARNAGIKAARGEFFSFFDPDDWADKDFYARLWAEHEKEPEADIIKGRVFYVIDQTGERVRWWERINFAMRKQLSRGTPLFLTSFCDHQSAIYRASLFRDFGLCYGTHRNGEDTSFLLKLCLLTQKISFADDAIYYYRGQRSGAATFVFSRKRLESELGSLEEKIEILKAQDLDDDGYRYLRRRFYHSMINYCMAELKSPDLKGHEPEYRASLKALLEKIPEPDRMMRKSSELQLLMLYDTLVPFLKEDFYSERIRRWTEFTLARPDVSMRYARDYAVMLLQSIRSYLNNKHCDLRRDGYFKTVWPYWRKLRFTFKLKVILYMIWLPIYVTAAWLVRRVLRLLGLEKKPDAGLSFGGQNA